TLGRTQEQDNPIPADGRLACRLSPDGRRQSCGGRRYSSRRDACLPSCQYYIGSSLPHKRSTTNYRAGVGMVKPLLDCFAARLYDMTIDALVMRFTVISWVGHYINKPRLFGVSQLSHHLFQADALLLDLEVVGLANGVTAAYARLRVVLFPAFVVHSHVSNAEDVTLAFRYRFVGGAKFTMSKTTIDGAVGCICVAWAKSTVLNFRVDGFVFNPAMTTPAAPNGTG